MSLDSQIVQVDNLPINFNPKEAKLYFKTAGTIQRLLVQREKGTAVIVYAKADDAIVATIKLNNTNFHGNNIVVSLKSGYNEEKETPAPESSANEQETSANLVPIVGKFNDRRIVIKNLNWKVTYQSVKSFFEKFGAIEKLQLEKTDGKFNGMAFLLFNNKFSAEEAVKTAHGLKHEGRTLFVGHIKKRNKSSPITNQNEDVGQEDIQAGSVKIGNSLVNCHIANDTSPIRINAPESIMPGSGKKRKRKQNDKWQAILNRRTIVVKNLTYKVSESEVRDIFGKFGAINKVTLLSKSDRTFCGTAFIVYKGGNLAAGAVQAANGSTYEGRILSVEHVDEKRKSNAQVNKSQIKGDQCIENLEGEGNTPDLNVIDQMIEENTNDVVITNLSKNAEANDVEQHFHHFGPIKKCFVKPNKGKAVITYLNTEDAIVAQMTLDKTTFLGQTMRVMYGTPKSSSSKKRKTSKEDHSKKITEMPKLNIKDQKFLNKKMSRTPKRPKNNNGTASI